MNIVDWVKIALKREQMRPTPPPSPRRPYLDDDDIPHIRRADDTGGSVNMADSVAERQRRYEERQRRYEAPRQRPARSPFDDEEQWAWMNTPGGHDMTDSEKVRHIGLAHALQEFEEILASWRTDEEPVDIDDLADLAVYEKP